MKRILSALLLAGASLAALASPSPKQIEQALQAHDYPSARSMIQQTLAEHPTSARAHLLDAYLLIHADHNASAARTELDSAKNLDTKGDVKNSPLFGRVVAEIDMSRPQVQTYTPPPVAQQTYTQQPAAPYAAPAPVETSSHWFLWTLVLLAIFGLVWYFVQRARATVVVAGGAFVPPAPMPPAYNGGYRPAPSYGGGGGYAPGYGSGYGGSGLGTAAAVGAGVVGGVLIGEALENAELRGELRAQHNQNGNFNSGNGNTFAPSAAPAPAPQQDVSQVSYDDEAQSLSSGGGNDWEDRTPAPAPYEAPSPSPSPFSSGSDDSSSGGGWGGGSDSSSGSSDSGGGSSDW